MESWVFAGTDGIASATLETIFDAEHGTPELIDSMARCVPQIREVMASLRQSLPLVPHSGIGPIGRFYRLPNHYRSISFILPPDESGVPGSIPGVIVFKGTEPLLADFPSYFEWMLSAQVRSSPLPIGLHFPLDMKLPPAAMWIEECRSEQAVSSNVQRLFLSRHDRLARLPLPLFVFKLTSAQQARYEDVVRSRISEEAWKKFRSKMSDGLGVEVYYYPELPVRVADLHVGNVRETFKAALDPPQVEATFDKWIELLSRILCLGFMPYVPWHHGMGSCLDPGNVCIDGGFNDLLTLVPFDAIPSDVLFQRSVQLCIQILADSMGSLSAAAIGIPSVVETDATTLAAAYVTEHLRRHVHAIQGEGHAVDARLVACFERPVASAILDLLRKTHQGKGRPAAQFIGKTGAPQASVEQTPLRVVAGTLRVG